MRKIARESPALWQPSRVQFHVKGHLGYEVHQSASIISSLYGMQTAGQTVSNESFTTSRPVDYEEISMGLGFNRFARITVDTPGPLEINYQADIETSSRLVPVSELMLEGPAELSPEVIPYLFPSRYCQSDRLREEASSLFPSSGRPYQQVETIVEWLYQNIKYLSGSTNEQSSAVDVFTQRTGVCRDFAHLGIAFCRALTIPARYVTVYAYQLVPQDFHACFEVYIAGRWLFFDATRLIPLNGAARISSGRDASDTAVASLFGNISGTSVSVSCDFLGTNFQPITRQGLQENQQAFMLL